MFDKIKELNELRKQAKKMQDMLKEEVIVVEKGNVKVKIRGDMEVEWVELDGEQRKDLAQAFNAAIKESQKVAAQKMRGQMGDFKIPGF
ncbi:hypothetical protein A2X44_03120 [candidate division CPR3 bacterium GWF2_35_18]|uniref:Nucleoid-associated protein n=1 Tax=candidate division CPR3 bacterium GW2011_GWF2_35_18 TaxID=1618350 RepID=A0A0G0EQ79_UNCC3|nr:MAG: hypothetical protein UR67_C0006G0064 [candidate division CPR3 bacterium GW2011_GWF2_35_18]KKP85517.1 MAG: hypothetical protein UR87_C0048G0011 [candidate division CPR3 bacterium GW2011_GWE2_35_7]OGB62969.1 MAG: hypothetical protein A2X44_03120 [candidate division CPR3 bacterium GWF2_35_18]OGB65905.1 MAG: hypothetical protein A2250_03270 [candidate division CPR3 bacterium RIFOXYA2_FULL_35_13]OGB76721.1 MAG: hypothetical protein A2476_00410 [candidate division CPR3 bacterium RIFOXYC2_FULL